jgi:hypothetical protein
MKVVQLAGCSKHTVVGWDDGDTTGRADERVAGATNGSLFDCATKGRTEKAKLGNFRQSTNVLVDIGIHIRIVDFGIGRSP